MTKIISAAQNVIIAHTLLHKYRFYFLLIPTVGAGFFLFFIDIGAELSYKSTEYQAKWNFYNISSKESYFIKTEGCRIPAIAELDSHILKYIKKPPNIQCQIDTNSPLAANNGSHIWIIQANILNYNISDVEKLSCCYAPFRRPKSVKNIYNDNVDDRIKYAKSCHIFNVSAKISHDFIKVVCEYDNEYIYKDFFAFVQPPKLEGGLRSKKNDQKLNVLIIGIDSVSRLNFHRTMPETLNFLKKQDAIELLGYNKVGDNTFPNVVPLLTGKSIEELKESCWPGEDATFDNCPFLWRQFKQAGYKTTFAEDASWMGIFTYLKRGFIGQPTDYYWRPFNVESERVIGHYEYFNANLCVGSRFVYEVLLAYLYDITKVLANYLHFGFFWVTSMSHDILNLPALTDKKYKNLLSNLYKDGYLNNTILLLMSDHGIRFGEIRQTYQGRLEERLPFVFFLLPDIFKKNFSLATSNIKRNVRYLTTPFDVHKTLKDFLDIDVLSNSHIKRRTKEHYANDRGISLFLPIPGNRSCHMAGIDVHWCTCHNRQKISSKEDSVKKAVDFVINFINNLIASYRQCAKLTLYRIIDASVSGSFSASTERDSSAEEWKHYTVVFQTMPGQAIFEATLKKMLDGFNMTGTVSRINRYGEQSRCVNQYHMKLYCYCNNLKNQGKSGKQTRKSL